MAKIIGVIGGVGPYAGINLLEQIHNQTKASCDQDYLPVLMASFPAEIVDRTAFLLNEVDINPAVRIAELINMLAESGAQLIGLPCNTAHAPRIWDEIVLRVPDQVELINMIEEVVAYIKLHHKTVKNVGVLSTTGTWMSRVYDHYIESGGLVSVRANEHTQSNLIQSAVYDTNYGIKSSSNSPSDKAIDDLHRAMKFLIDQGAELLVLGCTEMSLAIKNDTFYGVPVVDSNQLLARALVFASDPRYLI
jgi:aspartate racemase